MPSQLYLLFIRVLQELRARFHIKLLTNRRSQREFIFDGVGAS